MLTTSRFTRSHSRLRLLYPASVPASARRIHGAYDGRSTHDDHVQVHARFPRPKILAAAATATAASPASSPSQSRSHHTHANTYTTTNTNTKTWSTLSVGLGLGILFSLAATATTTLFLTLPIPNHIHADYLEVDGGGDLEDTPELSRARERAQVIEDKLRLNLTQHSPEDYENNGVRYGTTVVER